MQDELLLRQWIAGHDRFSADFHTGLQWLAMQASRAVKGIRRAYGAALRGTLAGAITLALWTALLALATPETGHAEPLRIGMAMALDVPAELVLA